MVIGATDMDFVAEVVVVVFAAAVRAAVVADVVVRSAVGATTRVVPVTLPLETRGAKTALPEIVGDVAAVDGTTVPLAGAAPTPTALLMVIAELAAVFAVVAVVPVMVPLTTCGAKTALPETVGEVAIAVGTTVPLAGVAPTLTAPVTASGDVAAVVAAAVVAAVVAAFTLPTVPRNTASSAATVAAVPFPIAGTPTGELTDGFTVSCGFTTIAGGTT
jgi:hypothetical protein